MFYFICKFDIFRKFIQSINDACDEVLFNTSDGIIYISFPKFYKLSSSGMSVLSKCTIKIPANTWPRGDFMTNPYSY